MTTNGIKLALRLTASMALALPVTAFAQEQASEGASNPGDIIVTARRSEERLQDVPISMTVFSQEQISNRNIVTAGDLATYTPSLSSNTRFGVENTSFAIRGFTQEKDTSPSVGVYFAEVVAPRASGNTTSGNGAGPGQLFDLQNVQVLKGPQGTLFGRNTTGGAVLLTPKKPTDMLEGYVEASLGNYDMRRVQAVINAPLADTFRVRLGFDTMRRDGYINNISSIGPRDFADINYWAFRGSVVAELAPNLENYTIVTYTKSDTNGSFPKMYAPSFSRSTTGVAQEFITSQLARTQRYYDVLNQMEDPFSRLDTWQAINTTTWQASDTLTVKNIASYGEYRQQQNFSVYGEYGVGDEVNGITTIPPGYHFYFGSSASSPQSFHAAAQGTFVEELQLQGRTPDGRLTYQLGGYAEISNPLGWQRTVAPNSLACRGDVTNSDCFDPARLPPPDGIGTGRGAMQDYQNRYWYRDYALFAQATYKITDQIGLTGGFRYTWSSVRAQSILLAGTSPSAAPGSALIWNCRFQPAKNGSNPDTGAPVPFNPTGVVQGGTSAEIRGDPSRCLYNHKQSASRPTWLIDVDYKPNEDVMFYAKWARGYRQGGLSANSFFGDVWAPEKLDTYEIGLKTSFRGTVSGFFNIAAFYNDFQDQQLQAVIVGCPGNPAIPTPPATPAQCPTGFNPPASAGIVNAGTSTIKGIEIDASISPLHGLRFDAGYAFLDTKVEFESVPGFPLTSSIRPPIGFTGINPRIINGGDLALAPRHKVTVTASYQLPISEDVGDITISGTYSYSSRQFVTQFAPSEDLWYLRPQNNVNLSLSWNNVVGQPLDFSVFVTNVTKEKYHTNRLGGSFGFDSAILNEPRMVGARVRVRFGN